MRMNKIEVKKLSKENNRISVEYDVSGSEEWLGFFNEPHVMFSEYNFSVEDMPYSVAVLPFVTNVLSLIWLFDATLVLDEIDSAYYNSIPKILEGFKVFHPKFNFGGKIEYNRLVENHSKAPAERMGAFFSGGVDATYTLVSHIEENPVLITIWGADMPVNNEEGWAKVYGHSKSVADMFNLKLQTVKSNFSVIQNKDLLTDYIRKIEPHSNWYEHFMYGPTFFGLVAPIAYELGIKGFYMASTYSSDYVGEYCCSSDPIIDDYTRFVDAVGIHDAYETNRQDKVHGICEYSKKIGKGIPLRVCFYDVKGYNCCKCEKCCRSMIAIIAEGENPLDYGFTFYNDEIRARMMYYLRRKYLAKYRKPYYDGCQKKLRSTYTYKECPDDLKWFYNLKLKSSFPKWIHYYAKLSEAAHAVLRLLHR